MAKKNWTTPSIKTITYDDLALEIKAMARSVGPCGSPGACSCGAACNPLAFHWSCDKLFVFIGKSGKETNKQ